MTDNPLVILGMDVGDATAMERWALAGQLPTVAGLMDRGSWGRITGPELLCEHGSGLSLFSGVSRAQHGHYYFRQLQPGTYTLRPVAAHEHGVEPFWAQLRGTNRRVAVIDPLEAGLVPGVAGVQLTNWATHQSPVPAAADPAEWLPRIEREFGPALVVDEDYTASPAEERRMLQRLVQRAAHKGAVCRRILVAGDYDLVVAMFYEPHTASHQFWKYRSVAGHPLQHAIREVYQAVDRELGLILAQLPATANVFVVSLFGMQDQFPSTGLMEAFCQQLGYHVRRTQPARGPRPIDLARRLIPQRVRFAVSQWLPAATTERLLADQLQHGTDWARTTAFAIPSLYTGFIRVNLRDREPAGCVAPAEYRPLLDRLEADLRQLVEPRSGQPAVERVVRAADLGDGTPPVVLPDLFVEWRATPEFVERVMHPRGELTQVRPAFCPGSEETLEGLVVAAGPGLPGRGRLPDVPVLELAPRFRELLGLPA